MAPQKQDSLDDESVNLSAAEEVSETESEEEVVKSTPNPIVQSDSEGEDDEAEEYEEGNEGSAEEEGSLCTPTASDFIIKPNILTKPAEKEKDSNPASKRPLEAPKDDAKKSKAKKKAKTGEENAKKDKASSVSVSRTSGAPRVWREEHELALLQGMIDYRNQKRGDPYANMNAFSDFVKGNLFPGVTKSQIYEKLRGLKAKFLKNLGKGEDGRDPVFSNPREIKTFELSKKVWGDGVKSNELEHTPNMEDSGKVKSNLAKGKAKANMGKEKTKKNDTVIMEKERTKKDDKVIMEKERTKKDDKDGSSVDGLANNKKDNGKVKSNDNGKVKSNLLNSKAKDSMEKERTKKDDKASVEKSMEKERTKKDDKASVEKESMKKDGKEIMQKESTKKDDIGRSFVNGLAAGVHMKITNCNQSVNESRDFLSNYPNLSASFDVKMSYLKENLHLIGHMEAKELEEGWTKLQMEEMELVSKRLSLMAKQTDLVLAAVKKS